MDVKVAVAKKRLLTDRHLRDLVLTYETIEIGDKDSLVTKGIPNRATLILREN